MPWIDLSMLAGGRQCLNIRAFYGDCVYEILSQLSVLSSKVERFKVQFIAVCSKKTLFKLLFLHNDENAFQRRRILGEKLEIFVCNSILSPAAKIFAFFKTFASHSFKFTTKRKVGLFHRIRSQIFLRI